MLPAFHSLLAVEPAHVCLAALYQEGDATLVRLYETTGQEATATLMLPSPVREATRVGLLNEPLPAVDGEALPIVAADGRRVRCRLRPWEVQTLALRA
jgi:alpha-mannosidase